MLRQPPSRPTALTPADIIGSHMAYDFKKHYSACLSGTTGGEFPEKKLEKELGSEIRAQIADIYRELRKNGFYPDGYTESGEILWRTALEDRAHRMLVDTMEPTPQNKEELEAMLARAREEFKRLGSMPDMAPEYA